MALAHFFTPIHISEAFKLSETALRANPASILRLENVGVLLGAGGMTLSDSWQHFEKNGNASQVWLASQRFIENRPAPELARLPGQVKGPFNVEALLDTLAILTHGVKTL